MDKVCVEDRSGAPTEPLLHRFMGVDLELAAGVLVPREETELLGRTAVGLIEGRIDNPLVIDMCCGSGNLALAIATHIPSARLWACDLTDETVALALRNAERCGFSSRVRVMQGDLFSGLAGENLEGQVDLIVCNPPYISTQRLESDSAHLLDNEPREAFDGGPYGISIHQRLVRDALAYLKPGGWLAFEFGEGQHRQAAALLARARGYEPARFAQDAAGLPRVAFVQKRPDA
ncbi:methyltransferase [Pararhizobium polonicum]|uniref:peptide chain release factor N(5)-glutamine methyltransferase n=1 Tax=Pararhizobium polonicum TaxID=1612624 RepID=A0A1C7P2E2_9HYPH|nr:HemK/PrmC family methyltransferase [Pararhizobium polonicum]OBZ95146.1 methyltransferase [Pararhizobium polonicum]